MKDYYKSKEKMYLEPEKKAELKVSRKLDKDMVEIYNDIESKLLENLEKLTEEQRNVMYIIWRYPSGVEKGRIIQEVKEECGYEDLILFDSLEGLENKKYVNSFLDENGERVYKVEIAKNIYLQKETREFFNDIHRNSFATLFSSIQRTHGLNKNVIKELMIKYGILDK